jgi:putative ABC transport system substrate-binding protein
MGGLIMSDPNRREFIGLLGGAAAWPTAARAQPGDPAVVGFINSGSSREYAHLVAAFQRGLGEHGYIAGQNLTIEYRWAEGRYDRLSFLLADLIQSRVAVIAAGGPQASLAAKAATSTIPVVFTFGDDPVKAGLVPSMNRPGGNVTGITVFTGQLAAKRLSFLHELIRDARVMGMIAHPSDRYGEVAEVQSAAGTLGLELHVLRISSESEFDSALRSLVSKQARALLVGADPLLFAGREQLVAAAARYSLPAIYYLREFAAAGGLMSYGASLSRGYYMAGAYCARILKGERPAELPVQQPTTFELVINLKTARTLGLELPPTLLATADEVIE